MTEIYKSDVHLVNNTNGMIKLKLDYILALVPYPDDPEGIGYICDFMENAENGDYILDFPKEAIPFDIDENDSPSSEFFFDEEKKIPFMSFSYKNEKITYKIIKISKDMIKELDR